MAGENRSGTKSKLQRLEADILKLKEKIKSKDKVDLTDTMGGSSLLYILRS
jgi:hypothetical protein